MFHINKLYSAEAGGMSVAYFKILSTCLSVEYDESTKALVALHDKAMRFEPGKFINLQFINDTDSKTGARGSAFVWGTALQAGRSRVPFPMVSLKFFIDILLSVAIWPWGRLSL
jgi:hypothetical protein